MRRMPRLALSALPAVLAGAVLLAGCSQVAAIKPVSGTLLVEVRFATIDVLLERGYALREVPACTEEPGGGVTCAGTTEAGEQIAATSSGGDAPTVTVTVGDDTVYDGPVLDVLDRAARAS